MANLLAPDQLPAWVPGQVLAASDSLGWQGVVHRTYRYEALDVPVPPLDHFMIVSYHRGQTSVQRRFSGRWSQARCGPGVFSLATRAEPAHWCWTEPVDVFHTYLSPALVRRVAADIMDTARPKVQLHDLLCAEDPRVSAITASLAQESQQQGLGGPLYAEALAMQLVVHLLREYASITCPREQAAKTLGPVRLRQLEDFIQAHLHRAITTEDMAAAIGLGVWTFSRHLRASVGLTPSEFVMQRRLQRAQQLLQGGQLAIKQVAADCGFADQAHMTRLFRAQLGITPGRLGRQD